MEKTKSKDEATLGVMDGIEVHSEEEGLYVGEGGGGVKGQSVACREMIRHCVLINIWGRF